MKGERGTFCPLTGEECRADCSWADLQYEMNADGITRKVVCSVAVIAAALLGLEDEDD